MSALWSRQKWAVRRCFSAEQTGKLRPVTRPEPQKHWASCWCFWGRGSIFLILGLCPQDTWEDTLALGWLPGGLASAQASPLNQCSWVQPAWGLEEGFWLQNQLPGQGRASSTLGLSIHWSPAVCPPAEVGVPGQAPPNSTAPSQPPAPPAGSAGPHKHCRLQGPGVCPPGLSGPEADAGVGKEIFITSESEEPQGPPGPPPALPEGNTRLGQEVTCSQPRDEPRTKTGSPVRLQSSSSPTAHARLGLAHAQRTPALAPAPHPPTPPPAGPEFN